MADNSVWIEGSDVDWATEKTQQQMLSAMKAAFNLDKTQTKEVSDTLKKIQKEGSVDAGQAKKAMASLTSGLKEAGKESLEAAAGFDKLDGPLKNFGKTLKESSGGFKVAMLGVGIIGNQLGKAIGAYVENVAVLRDLTDAGVIYKDSVMGVQETLASTGMSLERFGEMSAKYARVIGTNGLRGLNSLVESTQRVVGSFDTLGLTSADAAEYAAEYLEQQRMAGVFGRATQEQQSLALAESTRRLTAYSKALNVSRQQMQESTAQMLGREDLQRKFFTMDARTRERAQSAFVANSQAFSSLGAAGDKLLEQFTDMAASAIPQSAESFRQLSSVSPELAQYFLELIRLQEAGIPVSQEELKNKIKQVTQDKAYLNSMAAARGEIEQQVNTLAQAGLAAEEFEVKRAKLYNDWLSAGGEGTFQDFLESVDKNAEGATSMEDGMNKVIAQFDHLRMHALEGLTNAILGENGLANATDTMGDKMRALAGFMGGIAHGEYSISDLFGMAMDVIKPLLGALTSAIVEAIRQGWAYLKGEPLDKAAEALDNPLSRGISRLFQSDAEKSANFSMLSQQEQFTRAKAYAHTPVAPSVHGVMAPTRADVQGETAAMKEFYSERGITMTDEQINKLARAIEKGAQRGTSKGSEILGGS